MEADYDQRVAQVKANILSFPDFPKKGILFWDIFSALSSGKTCSLLNNILIETVRTKFPDVEAVVGLESRGFLFAFSLAAALKIACIPVRKKGKLPGDVVSHKYDLEYGSDILEIQKNSIKPGLKCLLIDDLIATGGSLNAAISLLQSCGADVRGCLVVIELVSLKGRQNIPDGDILEIQKNSIKPGLKCLLIDDLIATGGSLNAAVSLLQSCGADVRDCLVVIELVSLKGRQNIPVGVNVHPIKNM